MKKSNISKIIKMFLSARFPSETEEIQINRQVSSPFFYFLLFYLLQLLHRIKIKRLPYKIKISH